jgi:hypothetical protein
VTTPKIEKLNMHYKNGREAKVGDQIVAKNYNGTPAIEVVVAVSTANNTCNLTTIPLTSNTFSRTASEALHVDDAIQGLDFPKSTAPLA